MPDMKFDNSVLDSVANVNALQIFLVISMLLCWTVVYALIIYRNHKDKLAAMPWMALCLNISWELTYSLVIPYPDPSYRFGIFFWVILDAVMFFQGLKYGKEDYNKVLPGMEKFYYPVCLGIFVMMFAFVFAANYQWTTLPDAAGYTAYLMNLMMSLLFVVTLFRRKGTTKGLSIYIAYCKFWGSLAPTILGMVYLPTRYIFPYTLGIASAIIDVIYIILVGKHFRSLGINPYTGKPLNSKNTEAPVEVTK